MLKEKVKRSTLLETRPQSRQQTFLGQEPRPRIMFRAAISYGMDSDTDTYKNIGVDENLKEIQDKIDCLQRSQVYVHNQITKVEKSIDEFSLILRRLIDLESHDDYDSEILSRFVDDNGICRACGQNHGFQPDYEGVNTSIDSIPELFRRRAYDSYTN